MEKKKYPIGQEHYTLYEEVGQGVSASVHRALCKPFNEIVAIKILDLERSSCDLVSSASSVYWCSRQRCIAFILFMSSFDLIYMYERNGIFHRNLDPTITRLPKSGFN